MDVDQYLKGHIYLANYIVVWIDVNIVMLYFYNICLIKISLKFSKNILFLVINMSFLPAYSR